MSMQKEALLFTQFIIKISPMMRNIPRNLFQPAWICFLAVLLCGPLLAQHDEAMDAYLDIYAIFDQAQQHEQIGNVKEALTGYQKMIEELDSFRMRYPGWQEQVVQFRRQYASDRVRMLTTSLENNTGLPASTGATLPVTGGGNMDFVPYTPAQDQQTPLIKDLITTFREEMQNNHSQLKTLLEENRKNHQLIVELSSKYADASARLDLSSEKIKFIEQQAKNLQSENESLKEALSQSFSEQIPSAGSTPPDASPQASEIEMPPPPAPEKTSPAPPAMPRETGTTPQSAAPPVMPTSRHTSTSPAPAKTPSPENILPADYEEMMAVKKMEAKILRDKNQLDLAHEALEKLTITAPKDADAWLELGITQIMGKDLASAEKSLRESLTLQPDNAAAHANIGFVLYETGKLDESSQHLQKAIQQEPTLAQPWNYLGMIHFKKGQTEKAEESLKKATQINPQYGDAFYNLAVVHIVKNPPEKSKALSYYQQAVGAGVPKDPELEKMFQP